MLKNKSNGLSSIGFVLTAIGAAVGLGNLWGFPTKMIDYGGTAFLIPYIIGVIILGFPIMLLELNLGNKWRKIPTIIFAKHLGNRGGRFLGWIQPTIQMMIGTYYGVIISWIVISIAVPFIYGGYKPEVAFFNNDILGWEETKIFGGLGRIQPILLGVFFLVIAGTVIIVSFGIKKGIEKTNKIMMPFLFILIIFFFVYSLTLKGAERGLEKMFSFEIGALANGKAWSTAFSQALFTLSLCCAIMIVFSAHAPQKMDIGNYAIIIIAGDTLIALLACSIVSSAFGNALENEIIKLSESGKGYVFVADNTSATGSTYIFMMFPQIFAQLTTDYGYNLGEILGTLFYIALLFASVSTIISLQEPMVGNLITEDKMKRSTATLVVGITQFMFGLCFTLQNGSDLIDITDGLFVSWSLLIVGLIEVAIFTFSAKNRQVIYQHNNENSFLKLGTWTSCLLVLTFFGLLFIFGFGLFDVLFGDYNKTVIGWTTTQWLATSAFYFTPFLFFTLYKTFVSKPKIIYNDEDSN